MLVYSLCFQGRRSIEGIDGNVIKVTARVRGTAGPDDVGDFSLVSSVPTKDGGHEALELTRTGPVTFQVVGSIAFRNGTREEQIQIAGSGQFMSAGQDGSTYGAAICWIEGGDEKFVGATGLITSNLVITDSGDVTDYHVGIVHLQPIPPR